MHPRLIRPAQKPHTVKLGTISGSSPICTNAEERTISLPKRQYPNSPARRLTEHLLSHRAHPAIILLPKRAFRSKRERSGRSTPERSPSLLSTLSMSFVCSSGGGHVPPEAPGWYPPRSTWHPPSLQGYTLPAAHPSQPSHSEALPSGTQDPPMPKRHRAYTFSRWRSPPNQGIILIISPQEAQRFPFKFVEVTPNPTLSITVLPQRGQWVLPYFSSMTLPR